MLGVWLASAIYSTPKFIFSRTITNVHSNGMSEEICIMHRKLFNSKILDCVNFVALYMLPLLLMTVSKMYFTVPEHSISNLFSIKLIVKANKQIITILERKSTTKRIKSVCNSDVTDKIKYSLLFRRYIESVPVHFYLSNVCSYFSHMIREPFSHSSHSFRPYNLDQSISNIYNQFLNILEFFGQQPNIEFHII